MLFTHCTPGRMPINAIIGSTLQIYSVKVKVAEIHGFESPQKVYGVVAARDTVDSSRNPIFLRPRNGCQILNLQVYMVIQLFFLTSLSLLISSWQLMMLAGSLSTLNWPMPCNCVYEPCWHWDRAETKGRNQVGGQDIDQQSLSLQWWKVKYLSCRRHALWDRIMLSTT